MRCNRNKETQTLGRVNFIFFHFQHAGSEQMYDHIFTINADKYTVADEEGVVTGEWNLMREVKKIIMNTTATLTSYCYQVNMDYI